MSVIQNYKSIITRHFKNLDDSVLDPLISENLLCPQAITLPKSLLGQFQQAIQSFHTLRSDTRYISKYQNELETLDVKDPGNKSLFMSYDFHLNNESQPKLIEINTNAAFLALGVYLYEAHGLPTGLNFKIENLRELFQEELKYQNKNIQHPKILIVDEKPQEQKMFAEFLIIQSLIRSFGWSCDIDDVANYFKHKVDLVYNRYTDFFLKNPEAQALRTDFLNRAVCVSPNPFEYFLLADKQRMIDWCDEKFWADFNFPENMKTTILSVLPKTLSFKPELKDEIWSKRKYLFFKPKNSFGSKQSYKGASISRKAFDEVSNEHFLAQEFIPAPEALIQTPDGPQNFKFDLRCYAYRDQLQLVIARVYQGQVTNLKTKWGGFAPVKWV